MNRKVVVYIHRSRAVAVLAYILSVVSLIGLFQCPAGEQPADKAGENSAEVESKESISKEEIEVIADSAKVKVGDEVIASIKKGDRFTVNRRQGPWVGIFVESTEGERFGWVLANRVRTVVEAEGSESSTAPGPLKLFRVSENKKLPPYAPPPRIPTVGSPATVGKHGGIVVGEFGVYTCDKRHIRIKNPRKWGMSVPAEVVPTRTVEKGNAIYIERLTDEEIAKLPKKPYSGLIVDFHPTTRSRNEPERVKFYVRTHPVPEGKTLEQEIKPSIEELKKQHPTAKLIESGDTTLAGLPAHRLSFDCEYWGLPHKGIQIRTGQKGRVYTLEYLATKEEYPKHLGKARVMFESFEILTPPPPAAPSPKLQRFRELAEAWARTSEEQVDEREISKKVQQLSDRFKPGGRQYHGLSWFNDACLQHLPAAVTNLTMLNLDGAKITDAGLKHVERLPSLRVLKLGDTQISDAGLEHLKCLADLRSLDLRGTDVTDAGLQHLRGLPELSTLRLNGADVTDRGLEALKGMTKLRSISLDGTQVTDSGLKHLQGMTDLSWLSLNNTQVTDVGLEHLKGLTGLGTLYLRDTQVTGDGSVHLEEMTNLRTLSLDGTQQSNESLEYLSGMTNLQYLYISGRRVTDAGLVHLKGMTRLYGLSLRGTQVTDTSLESLTSFPELSTLDLSETQVEGPGLEYLRDMPRLSTLSLNDTKITDASLKHLYGMKRIRSLSLNGTLVTDAGLEHLQGLTTLTWLYAHGTGITSLGQQRLQYVRKTQLLYSGLPRPQQVDLSEDEAKAALASLKEVARHSAAQYGPVTEQDLTSRANSCLDAVRSGRTLYRGSLFDDTVLQHLKGVPKLYELMLADTDVTDAGLVHLEGRTDLKRLELCDPDLGDAGLVHLKGLTNLQMLDLRDSRVTDAGLQHLENLRELRWLYLNSAEITDAGMEHLKGLTQLAVLTLDGTQVTDAGISHLTGLPNLKMIYLRGTGVTDAGAAKLLNTFPKGTQIIQKKAETSHTKRDSHAAGLDRLKQIAQLEARSTRVAVSERKVLETAKRFSSLLKSGILRFYDLPWFNDEALEYLKDMTQLRELRLKGTQITDAGLKHIAGMKALRSLDLSHTQVSEVGLDHLKEMKVLQLLDLRDTQVSDAGLERLENMKGLRVLYLSGSQVTDEGIEKLKQALPNCRIQHQPPTTHGSGESRPGTTGKPPQSLQKVREATEWKLPPDAPQPAIAPYEAERVQPSGRQLQLAFSSWRDGNSEIYIMNADGSEQTNLTKHPAEDANPRWSQDGERIVFSSNRDGDYDIYVMNADGTELVQLTNVPKVDDFPCWSPDGQKILFTSDRDGNKEIYVMKADGSEVRRLTDSDGIDHQSFWSPDGDRVVFTSNRNGRFDIYIMDADGSDQTQLTFTTGTDEWAPCWSPDGKQIAFMRRDKDKPPLIYIMNVDGEEERLLKTGLAFSPVWSPDGTKIAFTQYQRFPDICVINVDGSGLRKLTRTPARDWKPSWRPMPETDPGNVRN